MFGLEQKPGEKFAFDLEKELRTSPGRAKEILEKAERRIQAIKKHLREGTDAEGFDQLGILLHGYTALLKVLRKVK